jgi:hypothetical protein
VVCQPGSRALRHGEVFLFVSGLTSSPPPDHPSQPPSASHLWQTRRSVDLP